MARRRWRDPYPNHRYYLVYFEIEPGSHESISAKVFASNPDQAFDIARQNVPAVEKVRGVKVTHISIVPQSMMHRRRI